MCMCVRLRVCAHVCMCVHTCVCACGCARMCVYMRAHVRICMCMCVVCMCVCGVWACACMCVGVTGVCMCVHVCVPACVCVYVCVPAAQGLPSAAPHPPPPLQMVGWCLNSSPLPLQFQKVSVPPWVRAPPAPWAPITRVGPRGLQLPSGSAEHLWPRPAPPPPHPALSPSQGLGGLGVCLSRTPGGSAGPGAPRPGFQTCLRPPAPSVPHVYLRRAPPCQSPQGSCRPRDGVQPSCVASVA